jgi:hypothetical protein
VVFYKLIYRSVTKIADPMAADLGYADRVEATWASIAGASQGCGAV